MERRTAAVSITSARGPRSTDIGSRQTRYVLSMLVRTACFLGAVFTEGTVRWVLVAAAIFLPYVAVVLANAAGYREPPRAATYTPPTSGEIGPRRPGADA